MTDIDILHSKDHEKAMRRFDSLCDEMVRIGIFEQKGEKLHITEEFQRRATELLNNPTSKEALDALENDPKRFLGNPKVMA